MWDPRRLTILWASTSCYRDSFTFFYVLCAYMYLNMYVCLMYTLVFVYIYNDVRNCTEVWRLSWLCLLVATFIIVSCYWHSAVNICNGNFINKRLFLKVIWRYFHIQHKYLARLMVQLNMRSISCVSSLVILVFRARIMLRARFFLHKTPWNSLLQNLIPVSQFTIQSRALKDKSK
jgi:hypothetical protein